MAETATSYEFNNPMGNWNAGTWNVLPGVLTAWSNLLALRSQPDTYALYREQARNYIDTARMNADLIRSQGEVALRNLRYKNKLQQGNDVVRIAVSNGKLSGSNLDMLVRKEKIRKMNETTLQANYTNQAMLEMVNGYRQAGNVYGTLAYKAGADKWSALASILKGVETYVGLQVRDAKVQSQKNAGHQNVRNFEQVHRDDINYRYGEPEEQVVGDFITRGATDVVTTGTGSLNNYESPFTDFNSLSGNDGDDIILA